MQIGAGLSIHVLLKGRAYLHLFVAVVCFSIAIIIEAGLSVTALLLGRAYLLSLFCYRRGSVCPY